MTKGPIDKYSPGWFDLFGNAPDYGDADSG